MIWAWEGNGNETQQYWEWEWEWELLHGNGRERESKTHSRTPLLGTRLMGQSWYMERMEWMERGFNALQTHRSMYPSIFNRSQ